MFVNLTNLMLTFLVPKPIQINTDESTKIQEQVRLTIEEEQIENPHEPTSTPTTTNTDIPKIEVHKIVRYNLRRREEIVSPRTLILRDLPRTFPELGIFDNDSQQGYVELQNVLQSVAVYYPDLGYVYLISRPYNDYY